LAFGNAALISSNMEWEKGFLSTQVGMTDDLKTLAALVDFGDQDFVFPGVHRMTFVVGLADASPEE
jgi:hypothetical protein